jgi:EmrB/QacA subfamily drug resistance transporter
VLTAVSLGALLAPLNSTMIAVALPVMRRDLGVSHGAVGWLISSYLIAMAVTQPVGGRLGDRLGRMRVFRAGLLAFLVFSVAAAAAPGFEALLVFRTLQAVAGAVLIPNGIGMLREAVPAQRFGKFSGLNSSVIGATAAVGPLLGGVVLAFVSWRWLFLTNIPVVVAAVLLAFRLGAGAGTRGKAGTVDWVGVALFAALLCLVTVLLNGLRSGADGRTGAEAAALVTIVALFVWRQAGSSAPAAEWRLFRVRSFTGASSHILLMNLAIYTTLLAVPFFLTEVQGRSSTVAGLLLGCMAALQALVAPVAGLAADRYGRRRPTVVSSVIGVVAAVLLVAGIREDVPVAYLALALTILGLGVGIGFVSATVAAVESAPRALAGSAAGTQSMMRYFGSIVGAGMLSGLLDTHGGGAPGIAVFRLLFVVVAAMVALSLVAAAMVSAVPGEREPV